MLVVEDSDFQSYHTGEFVEYDNKAHRRKPPELIDRRVIAWDMEGISLSGQDRPQHPVIYGCSAEPESALQSQRISMRDMLEYMIDVSARYPYAIHVGYAFQYDATMIIQSLSINKLIKLKDKGYCMFSFDDEYTWSIKWIPRKTFTVTRRPKSSPAKSRAGISLTVYDYSSFFGRAFLATCEEILRDDLNGEDREVIKHGKEARGKQSWDDIGEIRHYWDREIILIQRVFEKFRNVMYQAGFQLREWYGPGALANYINAVNRIRPKLAGVQTTSGMMPNEVHEASKHAFVGGRFELFQGGRVKGPIYAVDINSAYPYALTKLPSFEKGQWVHVKNPKSIALFGVYRIRYQAPSATPLDTRPMPLPHRDNRGLISYPNVVHGWYWSPEAAMVGQLPGTEIIEGWEWQTENEDRPWQFLHEMYDRRMRLGKKNLLSMPFKLGPNSLYGKYAQTVGWDQKKVKPPKSHALPVAGWVTSYCRAMLYGVMIRDPQSIVSVETDSIFTTKDPKELGLNVGDGLGQWDYSIYDEMIYLQSGMYHVKIDGEWKSPKSRGIHPTEFPYETAKEYVQSLKPGEMWKSMTITTKPKFIGLGAALVAKEDTRTLLASWRVQERKIGLGDTGKRVHIAKACPECKEGKTPWETPHRFFIHSRTDGETLSYPRRLPWEKQKQYDLVDKIRLDIEVQSDVIDNQYSN